MLLYFDFLADPSASEKVPPQRPTAARTSLFLDKTDPCVLEWLKREPTAMKGLLHAEAFLQVSSLFVKLVNVREDTLAEVQRALDDVPGFAQFILKQTTPSEDAMGMQLLVAEPLLSSNAPLIDFNIDASKRPISPATPCFLTILVSSFPQHHTTCHRVVTAVEKSVSFLRAQSFFTDPSRFMFMYVDDGGSRPIDLSRLLKSQLDSDDLDCAVWVAKILKRCEQKFQALGILVRGDHFLYIDPAQHKQYFLLFSWSQSQHESTQSVLLRKMFRQSTCGFFLSKVYDECISYLSQFMLDRSFPPR